MTTFTSEDRISSSQHFTDPGILSDPNPKIWSDVDKSWWGNQDPYPGYRLNLKNIKQVEIEFFFPLTEQIPLDLDYGPTHLHFRAKGIAGVQSMPIRNSIYEFTTVASNPVSLYAILSLSLLLI
jgi:hypothetical protein